MIGQAVLDPAEVVSRLKFTGFGRGSATPDQFRALVLGLSEVNMRQLLAFITASAALPRGEEGDRYYEITIQSKGGGRDAYPTSHTCFNRLDLPDYQDEALLRERLMFCLEHLQDAGFGEA
jgi:E3 ubiquitin-protein ligase NEDD4